jgi:hypothetical protein
MRCYSRAIALLVVALITLEAVAADPPPQKPAAAERRASWIYFSDAGKEGRIKKVNAFDWIENTTDGGQQRFVEVGRTPEYVELFDRTRALWLRLHAANAEMRHGPNARWYGLYDGHWENGDAPRAAENAADERPDVAMLRWEYKVQGTSNDLAQTEKAFNKLGEAGWELCFPITKLSGELVKEGDGAPHAEDHTDVQFLFKRPKNQEVPRWEYKVVTAGNDFSNTEKTLNTLGNAGWEARFSVNKIKGQVPNSGDGRVHIVNTSTVQLILSRPKN